MSTNEQEMAPNKEADPAPAIEEKEEDFFWPTLTGDSPGKLIQIELAFRSKHPERGACWWDGSIETGRAAAPPLDGGTDAKSPDCDGDTTAPPPRDTSTTPEASGSASIAESASKCRSIVVGHGEPSAEAQRTDDVNIHSLPDEILQAIFRMLDGGSVLAARLCCRRWYHAMGGVLEALQSSNSYPSAEPFIKRFTNLHSWYKHLPLDKTVTKMCLFLRNGMQERNMIHPGTDGTQDVHWHYGIYRMWSSKVVELFEKLPEVCRQNAVEINCFAGRNSSHIIQMCNSREALANYALKYHPSLVTSGPPPAEWKKYEGFTVELQSEPQPSEDGEDEPTSQLYTVNMSGLFTLEKARIDDEIRRACRNIVEHSKTTRRPLE